MQQLIQPRFYRFDREDIGRIVLFKSKENLALYPFMVIFNRHQREDFDDDILFKDLLVPEDIVYTINDLVGAKDLDYVKIVNDPVEKPVGILYSRPDDMKQGVLQVIMQDDGDVCLGIHNAADNAKDFKNLSVEFCTIGAGGGRSPNTVKALQDLVLAIATDINENPL